MISSNPRNLLRMSCHSTDGAREHREQSVSVR